MYEALTETCVLLAQEAIELDYCSSNDEYKDCDVEEFLLSAFGNLQRGNNKLRSVSKITVWDFSAKITVWEPDSFHDSPKRSSYSLLLLCLTLIKFKQTSVSGQGGVIPFFIIILSHNKNILNIIQQETIESLWKVERRQTVGLPRHIVPLEQWWWFPLVFLLPLIHLRLQKPENKTKVKVKSLSRVRLFRTPWTVAYQVSSLHGTLQARVLEWIAISFSRGSSPPRDQTWVSCIPGRRFNLWATRQAQK